MKFDYSKLRDARRERKLTLEDMANRMGMDVSAYWRLETGNTKVKAEQLIAFMDYFEKPYSYFFKADDGSARTVKLIVECLPDKLQTFYHFLKEHPGIIKEWDQKLTLIEEQLNFNNLLNK